MIFFTVLAYAFYNKTYFSMHFPKISNSKLQALLTLYIPVPLKRASSLHNSSMKDLTAKTTWIPWNFY